MEFVVGQEHKAIVERVVHMMVEAGELEVVGRVVHKAVVVEAEELVGMFVEQVVAELEPGHKG